MILYSVLLAVELVCTLALAKFTLTLYSLLQGGEMLTHRVKLTRVLYRRDAILRPLSEEERSQNSVEDRSE